MEDFFTMNQHNDPQAQAGKHSSLIHFSTPVTGCSQAKQLLMIRDQRPLARSARGSPVVRPGKV